MDCKQLRGARSYIMQVLPNHDAIPDIIRVHHKQEDDRKKDVADRLAEDEGRGNNDGGKRYPHFAQVHLQYKSSCNGVPLSIHERRIRWLESADSS